jgi:Histidine biosynthesis protein
MSHFILMLTRSDRTVADALDVYESLRGVSLTHVGFKDLGLPLGELRKLTARIHADGRKAMLEVVSLSASEELESVRTAIEVGADYVMGGRHAAEAVGLLSSTGIRYFPFCGNTVGHPTRLEGSIAEIVSDARRLAAMPGVHGLDLLSYRFSGDAEELTHQVVRSVDVPVIAAGSIDCEQRIQAVCGAGVWGFTIGSALFEGRFARNLMDYQARSIIQMPGVQP